MTPGRRVLLTVAQSLQLRDIPLETVNILAATLE
jgi:hypothetical protein